MSTTNHMPAQVKACIDTDKIQPTDELECTSKCPSWVKGRCTICSFHKNTVEESTSKKHIRTDQCAPVFDEIYRLYGEDRARRSRRGNNSSSSSSSSSKQKFVECAVVYKALNLKGEDTFDNKMTQLLTEGWQREGKFQIDTTGGVAFGVQMLTRTSYVVKAGEEDAVCGDDGEHDFKPQEGTGKFVCSLCGCYGVRLSQRQRSQLGEGTPAVICTADYEEKFLP